MRRVSSQACASEGNAERSARKGEGTDESRCFKGISNTRSGMCGSPAKTWDCSTPAPGYTCRTGSFHAPSKCTSERTHEESDTSAPKRARDQTDAWLLIWSIRSIQEASSCPQIVLDNLTRLTSRSPFFKIAPFSVGRAPDRSPDGKRPARPDAHCRLYAAYFRLRKIVMQST